MFQIGCFDLSFLLLRPSVLCSHLFRFSVNKHDDDDDDDEVGIAAAGADGRLFYNHARLD